MSISFDEAIPTKTHMALKKLIEASKYWRVDCSNKFFKIIYLRIFVHCKDLFSFRKSKIHHKPKYRRITSTIGNTERVSSRIARKYVYGTMRQMRQVCRYCERRYNMNIKTCTKIYFADNLFVILRPKVWEKSPWIPYADRNR